MSRPLSRTIGLVLGSLAILPLALSAAAAQPPEPESQPDANAARPPEIPDEPRTIDPATLVPQKLAAPVTVEFTESSLREVGQWIERRVWRSRQCRCGICGSLNGLGGRRWRGRR